MQLACVAVQSEMHCHNAFACARQLLWPLQVSLWATQTVGSELLAERLANAVSSEVSKMLACASAMLQKCWTAANLCEALQLSHAKVVQCEFLGLPMPIPESDCAAVLQCVHHCVLDNCKHSAWAKLALQSACISACCQAHLVLA